MSYLDSFTHEPEIEVAVYKKEGINTVDGGRDVVIKTKTDELDLNQTVGTLTIPNIEKASLSIVLRGFDLLEESGDNEYKIISGNIYIKALIDEEEDPKLYPLHNLKLKIYPINTKTNTFPSIHEVSSAIDKVWKDAFGEALADIFDQTTIITGNVSPDLQQYALDNNDQVSMRPHRSTKSNPESKTDSFFWLKVGGIAIICTILIFAGIRFISSKSSTNIQEAQLADQQTSGGLQLKPEQLPPEQLPDTAASGHNSEKAIEKEVLDEFGLESNVNLDQ
ncbi:TPA: hypothetical protein ACGIK9_002831 [Acinetobacter baumannii]|uniref:hypothetical protein n=1 Tax=Acinetobacter baumannii TaxID=470 RepID=UPI0033906EFD